jgi:hypothetical protein
MIGAMIMAKAMPLWQQAVSAELQEAIQDEVRREIGRGRFRFGGGPAEALQVLIPIAFFAMVVLIVFVVARRRQAELRARAEFQKQILDKFSSGKEFADFLGTEGSQRFLQSLSGHPWGSPDHALRGMRGGITLAIVGLGFLLLTALRRGFVVPGVLFLAIGAGLLLSVAASHHFSKKWSGGGPTGPSQTLPRS